MKKTIGLIIVILFTASIIYTACNNSPAPTSKDSVTVVKSDTITKNTNTTNVVIDTTHK